MYANLICMLNIYMYVFEINMYVECIYMYVYEFNMYFECIYVYQFHEFILHYNNTCIALFKKFDMFLFSDLHSDLILTNTFCFKFQDQGFLLAYLFMCYAEAAAQSHIILHVFLFLILSFYYNIP